MNEIDYRADTTSFCLEATAALVASHWPEHVDLFREEVTAYAAAPRVFDAVYVQALHRGRVIGIAVTMASVMSINLNAITWVCVATTRQRQGIGRELVGHCLARAKAQGRSVVLATSSLGFYGALGFDQVLPYGETGHFLMTATPR